MADMTFDLRRVSGGGTKAAFALTGIGLVFAGAPLLDGNGVGVKIVGGVVGGLLLLLGLTGLVTVFVVQGGGDELVIGPQGMSRSSRVLGFSITWDELAQVGFGTREVGRGYDAVLAGTRPPGAYKDLYRWPDSDSITRYGLLYFTPVDPTGFARRHRRLDNSRRKGREAFVGARFGQLINGTRPDLERIGAAIAHAAGPRFGRIGSPPA